tara:strand:+ start:140 stop:769 length:630 start_codon:yes stop_codon:yes gene_type:complete
MRSNIEELYRKRFHTKYFNEEIPDRDLIESMISKTYDLVPSKQLIVPYKVEVLGPERKKDIVRIREFCMNYTGLSDKGTVQMLAPYLLLFTTRHIKEEEISEGMKERLSKNRGSYHSITYPHHITPTHHVEVGMFASILTGLCMENGVSTAYSTCMPGQKHEAWNEIYDIVKGKMLFIMSLGYTDMTEPRPWVVSGKDHKPSIKTVIKF